MAIETRANARPATPAKNGYTPRSTTSRDGTTIGYREIGSGPGIIMVHGAMESAESHMQLAVALADAFTIYLPDRRGRGTSGPYKDGDGTPQNMADLEAILAQTGARDLFGVSSGGIICLQAALALPVVRKVAVYEPPLFIDDPTTPSAVLSRYDAEIAAGDVAAALVTGMQGAQMGPPIFNALPRWLLAALTKMMLKAEERKAAPDAVTMRKLAPTLHYDFQLVVEASQALDSFRAAPAEVLLLGGGKSPAYLQKALGALETILPRATRVEFPGLNHGGSGNTDRGGQPETVARELRRFFTQP